MVYLQKRCETESCVRRIRNENICKIMDCGLCTNLVAMLTPVLLIKLSYIAPEQSQNRIRSNSINITWVLWIQGLTSRLYLSQRYFSRFAHKIEPHHLPLLEISPENAMVRNYIHL